jgi:uncharacterized membrane protein
LRTASGRAREHLPERREGTPGKGRLPRLGWRGVVVIAALLYAVGIGGLSMYKHEVYGSSRFDLGNMDQAVWNSAHGRILEATDETGELTSRLRNHADLILLAFVPLYWIHASPHWLLAIQAAVVGLGALPLFWLARRFLGGREAPAALLAVAYLLDPGLQSANLFDFHAQMMAGTFLLFAFHYLLERRLLPFVVFGALAALTKEGIVLIVAMMGLYAIFPLKRPRWGVLIFVVGTAYFLLTMLVLIPAFNAGSQSTLVEGRYGAFGGSISGVVRTALTDPIFMLRYVLTPPKLWYLADLVGATGFLAVLAPLVLVIPAPELAVNLLADRPQMTETGYHYSAPIVPFVYVAAAAGLANLILILRWAADRFSRSRPRWALRVPSALPTVLAAGVVVLVAELNHLERPIPRVLDPPPEEHRRALGEALELVPEGAAVSATNHLGAHLAHRRYLYLFPTVGDAEYVIVDEAEPDYDTYVSPIPSLASLQRLREDPDYRILYSESGVTVFERVGAGSN